MIKVRAITRLALTAVTSLMETHARQLVPPQKLSFGKTHASLGLEWSRRRVNFRGHTSAAGLTIAFEGREGVTVGDSFDIKLDRPDRYSGAIVTLNEMENRIHFPAPNTFNIARALLSAIPIVLYTLIASAKDIAIFIQTRDPATAGRLRRAFGITPPEDRACIIPDDLFLVEKNGAQRKTTATIVVPIFNASDDLARLLERLKNAQYPIIFVNDASTDPSIDQLLKDHVRQHPSCHVIKHEENLGFVAAANAGIKKANGHVILLNSDALPPKGDWVSRLLEPIMKDPNVASVTPFSNNAEIVSVPSSITSTDLCNEVVDVIDRAAQRFSSCHRACEIPTGIGFCMAMNHSFLKMLGPFDPIFGRGYGEEVDWCQKAVRKGGENLCLTSLFVGHKGGASFGEDETPQKRIAAQIISSRYPNYDSDVQKWVKDAPVQPQMLALSIAWLSALAEKPVQVFIGHSMGGGAETALQNDIAATLETESGVIILRVGGPSLWRIEVKGETFSIIGDASSETIIAQLLDPIENLHLVYSCGVGGRHPTDAPNLLMRLFDERCTLEIRVHDFFPISPSWNLLDAAGRFEGVPELLTNDAAHSVPALNGRAPVTHEKWRQQWSNIFSQSEKVVVYSDASRALIAQAYPSTVNKLCIRPHKLEGLPAKVSNAGQTLGILGSLNRAKGAAVVHELSKGHLKERRLVVMGELDGEFGLRKPNVFHGVYSKESICDLAQRYEIGAWLIPSICPETFSFTTHEALATGLPVLAFARGAQGEAVAKARNGYLIKADPDDTGAVAAAIEDVFRPRC